MNTRAPGQSGPLIVPLAVSAGAAASLRGASDSRVRVLARYASGVVLQARDAQQVFVSARGKGLLPAHIVLRRADFQRLRLHHAPGSWLALGHAASGALTLSPAGRRLSLVTTRLESPSSTIWRESVAQILSLMDHARPGGLGLAWTDLQSHAWPGRPLFDQETAVPLPGQRAALSWLLGRGRGSTPAGDDMLVGALACHCTLGQFRSPLVRLLSALRSRLPELTTPTSCTYLDWALRRCFASHWHSLGGAMRRGAPRAQMRRRLFQVLDHGETSGLDGLLGFLLVAQAQAGSGRIARSDSTGLPHQSSTGP